MKIYPESLSVTRLVVTLGSVTVFFICITLGIEAKEGSLSAFRFRAPEPRGRALVHAHQCYQCHSESTFLVGPSYLSLRKKYSKKDLNVLIESVSKGSLGTWGSTPMPPHPTIKISEIDTIVTWILAGAN